MKIPVRPPLVDPVLTKTPDLLKKLLASKLRPDHAGNYLHWDQLRWKPPPEGLTHEQWWVGLKVAREAARRSIPFEGSDGTQASVVITDSILRKLHLLDRALGGPLGVADPGLTNEATRDRYIVTSLFDEAISSSLLEGAATTRREARELLTSGRKPQTRDEQMIWGNHLGMQLVRQRRAQPLTPEFLLELHRALCTGSMADADVGRLRRADEAITVQAFDTGDVLHLPPPAGELDARLEATCAFANAGDDDDFLHPVLRAIAVHFALAYDHPFVDGNGRLARAAFYWSLLHSGYWIGEFLSISTVLQRAPAQYSMAFLLCETDGLDLTYFAIHQLEAIEAAQANLRAWIDRKASEVKDAEKLMRGRRGFNHRQRDLLADALRRPGGRYTIETHQRVHAVVYQTARTDLLALARAGLLKKTKAGRGFSFVVPDDFEQRLRHRT
jgi:Fic family protein